MKFRSLKNMKMKPKYPTTKKYEDLDLIYDTWNALIKHEESTISKNNSFHLKN